MALRVYRVIEAGREIMLRLSPEDAAALRAIPVDRVDPPAAPAPADPAEVENKARRSPNKARRAKALQ